MKRTPLFNRFFNPERALAGTTLLLTLLFTPLCLSCGSHSSDSNLNDSIWIAPPEDNSILSLDESDRDGSVRIGEKDYTYHYHFQPSDSLPIVVNADGQRYRDNVAHLTVRREGTVIFSHRFTKQSFTNFIAKKDLAGSALVGFSYNLTKTEDHTQLRFIATVGDPDETAGINYPIEIKVQTSGQWSTERAQDIETEPLIEGLNVDPDM